MIIQTLKILFSIGGILTFIYVIKDVLANKDKWDASANPVLSFIIGFIADFLDALGIGSYAITMTLNRFMKQIPDQYLPGTLAVGIAAIPTVIESITGLTIIPVDPTTILVVVIASAIGGILGAKWIGNLSLKKIRMIVGTLLLVVFFIQLKGILGTSSTEEVAGTLGLEGAWLVVGAIGAFVLGVLQTGGLGFFAPAMALFLTLGMDPKSIFPVMYTGCIAGIQGSTFPFIKSGAYARKATLFLMLGGIIGVLVAISWVKSMDVSTLKTIVTFILGYVGAELIYKGIKQK